MDVIAGNGQGGSAPYGDSALARLAVICIRLRLVPSSSAFVVYSKGWNDE